MIVAPRLPARSFTAKLAATGALLILGDQLFFARSLSHGYVGLFAVSLLGALLLVRPGVRADRRALIAAGAAAIHAAALVWDTSALAVLLFAAAVTLATLLPGTGRFDDGWRWLQRFAAHGLFSLVGPLTDALRLARARRRRPRRFAVQQAVPMLALPMIGTAAFVLLFANANPVVEALLDSVTLPELSARSIGRLIFWVFLFGLIWAVLRPRRLKCFLPVLTPSAAEAIPGVSRGSVLISLVSFNLLFAAQNAMDLAWLWGLLPLPEGMSLADYAHRGAYPLIVTALLAALFVLVTLRPGATTSSSPAIRRLVILWLAQNVVLVASAMLRLADYVDAYSLTRLRIAAFGWMVLVAAGLVLIGWRLIKGRNGSWLINSNLVVLSGMLTLFAFVDTGAVAAQWNVRHAREVDGSGARLDLCYLSELGPSALGSLTGLERHLQADPLRDRVGRLRRQAQWRLAEQLRRGEWTLLGARRLATAENAAGATLPPSDPIDCDGNVLLPEVAPAAAAPRPAALTRGTEQ